jgi:hypothetical protein
MYKHLSKMNIEDERYLYEGAIVWSNFLYEIYWNMVKTSGFTDDIFEAEPKHGNTAFLLLIIKSIKNMACFPNVCIFFL